MKVLLYIIKKIIPSAFVKQTVTVRFAFPLLFLTVGYLGIANIVSTSPSAISLELTTSVVGKGSDFQINVYASAKVPVNAIDIAISYPADTIEVLGVDKGQSVVTLWTEEPKAENGLITLTGGTYRKGFIGKHLVATVNARALKDGKANFFVKKAELLAGDGKASLVATDLVSGRADISVTTNTTGGVANDQVSGDVKQIAVYVVTDINGDGKVSMSDITTFMSHWFSKDTLYDFNNDGKMSINDFSILLSSFVSS